MELRWWRVVFDDKGSVLSCDPVNEPGESGRLVAYVQGATKLDARMNCAAWYRRYRAQQAVSAKRIRERRKAGGKCGEQLPGCLGDPDPGYVTCRSCRARKRAANVRYENNPAPRPRPTPEQARQTYLKTHSRSLHARTVLRMFDQLGPVGFRRWLVDFIEAADQSNAARIRKDPLLKRPVRVNKRVEARAQ
jgi:hypothetical protein